jgi:hypothetical protein
MILNDRLYHILKHLTQIVLPAFGTLYFALSEIWGLPGGAEVVGTTMAVVTFLGVSLGLSSRAYHHSDARFDGAIDIYEDDDVKKFVLNIDDDPYNIEKKDEIVLKVNS